MLGEMMFGSVAMSYKGSTLKIHQIRSALCPSADAHTPIGLVYPGVLDLSLLSLHKLKVLVYAILDLD